MTSLKELREYIDGEIEIKKRLKALENALETGNIKDILTIEAELIKGIAEADEFPKEQKPAMISAVIDTVCTNLVNELEGE